MEDWLLKHLYYNNTMLDKLILQYEMQSAWKITKKTMRKEDGNYNAIPFLIFPLDTICFPVFLIFPSTDYFGAKILIRCVKYST